ncbi:MAG: hypothetical protein E7256_05985 [Lachnospiraceae bacterium]|nr:hypothetical protein [Lachnospiraceae bacterium]
MEHPDKTSIYEIAYMLCDKEIGAAPPEADRNEVIDNAIKDTISRFGDMVSDTKALKRYLDERISREREEEEPAVLLGEEAENESWWLDYRKDSNTKLKFWDRYYKYLYEEKHWERSAIKKSIDNTTDTLLNSIANPQIMQPQEKRAMVVGYVQSGKTANYIGLINKALDAGYKYIIVLAGIHNNLRSQTQSRIDEEVLGYETDSAAKQKQRERAENNKIGVGKLYNAGFVQTLTFRDENGDFTKDRSGVSMSPDIPTIIVAKKIKSTLENLINYIESNSEISKDEETGELHMRAKYPLLLIDDEADQASVNTGYEYDDDGNILDEYNVKAINKLIRSLFKHFDSRSYVGYTATPYANIFIPNNITVAGGDLGNDLFPADCIVSLPKPYRYIGANEFFGYGNIDEDMKPMPLMRTVTDNFVDVKKKVVGELPESIKRAVKSFLISIAVRNCRGEKNKPNTMLIHVARLKNMHETVERKVKDYFFDELQCMIIDGDAETKNEFYKLIEEDYLPTTKSMKEDFGRYMEGADEYDPDKVYEEIIRLMNEDKIKIHVINGDSKDSLAYKEQEGKEYNVIAIGGDKFSRGLTLEGLSISYFTRESKYYDTLMQMGRWFGFRPKYADLCRVFIKDEVYQWFARVAFATDDLRNQISYMSEINAKPKEFGLRVATHPQLKISSPNKVKTGIVQKLDFSNTLTITRDIDVDLNQYENNYNAVNKLFLESGKVYTSEEHFKNMGREPIGKHLFLEHVTGQKIAHFLQEFQTSKHASKVNGINIATYIREQLKDDYLTDWTVGLINITGKGKSFEIAGYSIGSGITRYGKNSVMYYPDKNVCSVHMLKSAEHEFFGLNKEEYGNAKKIIEESKRNNEKAISSKIRAQIDKKKGLMLIYPIDFSDPESETRHFKISDGNHKPPFGLVFVFPEGNGRSKSYHLNPIAVKGEDYVLFD